MKDFLLLANVNAITYKEFFPLLKEGKVNTGYIFNKTLEFETPEGETKKQTGICWYTTFPVIHKHLVLTKTYNPQDYPKYDNYDAIEVSRIKDIPKDYDYVVGVPITIFGYDLDNVEVQGLAADYGEGECFVRGTPVYVDEQHPKSTCMVLYNKAKYKRILIKKNFEIEGLLGNFKEADCNETTGFLCGDDVSAYNLPGTQNGPVIITPKGPEAKYKRILIKTTNPRRSKTNSPKTRET